MQISQKHQNILSVFLGSDTLSSSEVHEKLLQKGESVSLVTVKRALSEMVVEDLLISSGSGRSTAYGLMVKGRIFTDVDAQVYCAVDPDKRPGMCGYNFDLFPSLPGDIFTDKESVSFEDATQEYMHRTEDISPVLQKKELERLVIELSWKSSKIEGNTYTLLDTEKLILESKEAAGHNRQEAQMILNHKDAFAFVREHAKDFKTLTRANLERLHAVLVKDLEVGTGLRSRLVGITGSVYRPLDNIHQIREGIDALSEAVARMTDPYAKALIALLGISYLQPFEDGNKRTARLMANALLLAHGRSALSYRSVDENEYREATLVFYETNSIVPFKKIFVEQYDFAARNYAVK